MIECIPKKKRFNAIFIKPVTLSLAVLNCYQKVITNKRRYTASTGRKKPWVAEITGTHPVYGLDRVFLNPLEDKTDSLSTRSRDGHRVYHLFPGKIYEVHEHISFKHEERYLCIIIEGKLKKITRDQALKGLAKSD